MRKPMYFYSISILFLIDSISSLILMRSILNLESPIQQLNSESLFFSFIIFVFNASILVVGVLFIALVDKEIYSKIVQEGYERQKDIIRELELNISSINKNQHEYGNNLSTVNALLINNQVDKARAFLHETLNINNEVTKLIRKSTSFAEIIVNYKLEEAVSKGIKVDSSIDISNDVPINQYDIAILLNNAFNNAIEACMKVAPTARYIKCSIYLKLGYLNFYFENSCIGDYKIIDGKLETSKIDSTNHGIGLQNIEYIVNKYDGFMKYQLENDKFVLKCSLLIESSFMDECLG
ncbi:ATP-binding protein [Clostridium cellulovorans]|uniref:ATP-binding protein n=1 Tax=Clostridium cellulovorans TaxID=1493 RepID=UPI001F60180C|nr:ATP-binding protein [Clostridium cellulovorans]